MLRKEVNDNPRGSLKWIRLAVNSRQELLDREIKACFGLPDDEKLQWVSPLARDEYVEYSDQDFLKILGITLTKTPLSEFWPKRGPSWDALALTRANPRRVLLVEAKAYTGELKSGGCRARPAAEEKIRDALRETQSFLEVNPERDWMAEYYQYANRLAHLYLLRRLNDIDAYLVYVCFLNDTEMGGPTIKAEWATAIAEVERKLGILNHKLSEFVGHIYIDVNKLQE